MGDKEISDILQSLGKIWDAINDLRVLLAGNYVTKDDLDKVKEENATAHNEIKAMAKGQVPVWLAIVLSIMTGIIVGLSVNAFKHQTITI